MSRAARAIAVAASAGRLAASGGAAAGASSTTRTVLPPRLFKPMLPRARAKSRLAVLLPSRIKVDLFSARGVVTGRLDSARAGHYELVLEDRHHRAGIRWCPTRPPAVLVRLLLR